MKISRLLIVVLAVVLVTSTWGLTPVLAQPSASVPTNSINSIEHAAAKLASLRVDNRTGGTLYVTLTGPRNYYFSTSTYGKTTFQNIEPGKYTIRVSASNCSGSLSYKRNLKGKETLKPFVCKN